MESVDKLREWMKDPCVIITKKTEENLLEMFKAVEDEALSMRNLAWNEGYDAGFASADDWLGQHEDAMAEHGWVKLPVDADGEVVRIGDVMVMASHPFGCEDKPLVVDRMELSRGMHGEVWCLALDTDRSCWTQAAVLRHYHAPTVEDVLREMHAELDEVTALYVGEAIDSDERDRDEARIFAEYAKRLTLAGDAE